ncbi:amidase [Halomonas daqingensis]|uniref:Amidase n=1 Tax=Billgrantia desiderata TaxID=52021 RepID=A0ABS9B0Z8_9GAMM|nr:amidase [Halomonas desiderata]MCE8040771.1 amidase [Halomonas desiderata]MCE8045346.1 amidase [Halomonas desiderata]
MTWTLKEAASAVRKRKIGCVELVSASLEAARRVNRVSNCFIRMDEAFALDSASAVDRLAGGEQMLMAGIPMAHKDMFHRKGMPCSYGSSPELAQVPQATSRLLNALDRSGAVQVGSLNMSEFAFGATGHNDHFGACRNPWNPAYIAGGSSSGSGAAVASGVVFAALGSDTGGSVRIPAAACGAVGLKPTHGLLPSNGVMPMSRSLDCFGPIGRTAEDVALIMDCLASAIEGEAARFSCRLGGDVKGLRVGIPENYYYDDIDPIIESLMEASLLRLEQLGCKLVKVKVPGHQELTSLSYIILGAESATYHAERFARHEASYGQQTRARLLHGFFIPAAAYVQAKQLRGLYFKRFMQDVMSQCDVLHTPVFRRPTPTLEETDLGHTLESTRMISDLSHCTRLTNYLGLPAVSLPCGFCPNDLPVGFQLIGRPFDEPTLLGLAHAHEKVSGIRNLVAQVA